MNSPYSPFENLRIGVLALQGAFAKHLDMLRELGVPCTEVRNPEDLDSLSGLIIPGGESSTMLKLMDSEQWTKQLLDFGNERPVLGTCAGMILMGSVVDDPRITPFGWMPLRVLRNAYGAQVNSFQDVGSVRGLGGPTDMEMLFIRAPKIEVLSDEVEVLGTCRNNPVLVKYGSHVATAFHPELTSDTRVHQYWLNLLVEPAREKRIPIRTEEGVT